MLRSPSPFALILLLSAASASATTATHLTSFEGIEEPLVRYAPATGTFTPDRFVNITEVADGTFRMLLRYRSDEWDGDRDTKNTDRQRAEVKGLGPHQKHGETFEYATTWRTNPEFNGAGRFCHLFQVKATNGDNGAPLITLSILAGTSRAAVHYWPGHEKSSIVAREFAWKPGTWQTVRIRVKTSPTADGAVTVSVDGDAFQGVTNVAVFRPEADDYRPKWGLYRGAKSGMTMGDDFVEHKNVSAIRIAPEPTTAGANTGTAISAGVAAARQHTRDGGPDKALAWLRTQPASPERAEAAATLAAEWAGTDPAAAMAWARALPAGSERATCVLRVFNRWSDLDVAAVSRWLGTQPPDPELDEALWSMATDTTYRYVNRPIALDAAARIVNPQRRALAFEQIVLIWARNSAAEATDFVAKTPALNAEQKKTITEKIRAAHRES